MDMYLLKKLYQSHQYHHHQQTQIDNTKDIDKIVSFYNVIYYSDNYSKTSGSLRQYYRDEPFLDANGNITNFPAANNNIDSSISKQKITSETVSSSTKDIEIILTLKYFSNFCRTLKIPLIDCKINLILTWPNKYVLSNDVKAFAITDTKLYVPVGWNFILSINAKLQQQLKSDFKRKINSNKG